MRAQDATLDGFEYRLDDARRRLESTLDRLHIGRRDEEQEPNDDPNKPQSISVPCTFVGRYSPRGDYDWISFDAKKGDAYWVEAISQRLGLPTDPYVLIQRALAQ